MKKSAGIISIAIAILGVLVVVRWEMDMRERGKTFHDGVRAATPSEREIIFEQGEYEMHPSKVGGRTYPLYTLCAVIFILGLMFLRDAKSQQTDQPNPHTSGPVV